MRSRSARIASRRSFSRVSRAAIHQAWQPVALSMSRLSLPNELRSPGPRAAEGGVALDDSAHVLAPRHVCRVDDNLVSGPDLVLRHPKDECPPLGLLVPEVVVKRSLNYLLRLQDLLRLR